MPDTTKARHDFAAALTERLHKLPAAHHDWYEALIMAALDETQGDLPRALALAEQEYAAHPDGGAE